MTPIKTIIRNKTNTSKTIHWAGKDTHWLPAGGDTVVPFEIWSVADAAQKNAIKAAVASGTVELTIMVLGPNGEYTVAAFSPNGAEPVRKQVFQEIKNIDTTRTQIEEDDHTVRVNSKDTDNVMAAYGAKKMTPGKEDDPLPLREVKNGEPEPVAEAAPQEAPVEAEAEVEQAEPKKRKSKKVE